MNGRRLEHEILKRWYPELARLPLDRNSFDTTPLLPRTVDVVRGALSARVRTLAERLGLAGGERRYYYRTFDFNGPHWRAVRRAAEPYRENAYALFDRATFDELVPPPEARWDAGHGVFGSAGSKMLIAVAVWLGDVRPSGGTP
jgi:asparagine synthase (glutamine-hydrolysing)